MEGHHRTPALPRREARVAASFINRGAEHQAHTPDNGRRAITTPPGVASLSAGQLLERLDSALLALRADESVDLTAAYLHAGFDRPALIETLAYLHTQAHDRDRLLLAGAKHTAGHRKYGDAGVLPALRGGLRAQRASLKTRRRGQRRTGPPRQSATGRLPKIVSLARRFMS